MKKKKKYTKPELLKHERLREVTMAGRAVSNCSVCAAPNNKPCVEPIE